MQLYPDIRTMQRKNIAMKYKIICITLFITLFDSCGPKDNIPNPLNYEDYITISYDRFPAVSPNGKWIAYFHKCIEYPESDEYPTGLYIIDIEGNNRKLIIKGNNSQPCWSPDCEWLAYSNSGTIQITNINGDSTRVFTGVDNIPLFYPDWSDDGLNILISSPYINGGGGFIIKPDFSFVRQLYTHHEFNAFPIKWGINGQYIAVSFEEAQFEEIVNVDTLLQNKIRLTYNETTDRYPAVSSDNRFIAWSSNIQIYRMDNNGSNKLRLDYGHYPSWTPDSKFIVYSFANDDYTKEVLFKINIDGGNKIQLTF